jgi:hypothetical protein
VGLAVDCFTIGLFCAEADCLITTGLTGGSATATQKTSFSFSGLAAGLAVSLGAGLLINEAATGLATGLLVTGLIAAGLALVGIALL